MANKMKSLMESILGKMTDESGLFQGGEQGRAFGRIRDLFGGGGGAHENIDSAIELSGGAEGYTEPSRLGRQPAMFFEDILKSAAPHLEIEGKVPGSSPNIYASNLDQIMQAILYTGFGERLPYSDPKNAPYYEKDRASGFKKDYETGEMFPEHIARFEEGAWYPEAYHTILKRSYEDYGRPRKHRYGEVPRDVTDIVGLLKILREYGDTIYNGRYKTAKKPKEGK